MSGDLVIVDEAHFIPKQSIQNGPLAMLAQNAYIIMACTPPRGPSGIEGILNGILPDGRAVCKVMDYKFTCPDCMPILKINKDYECMHRKNWRPSYQSEGRIATARACFGEDDFAFNPEMNGLTVSAGTQYISDTAIRGWSKNLK